MTQDEQPQSLCKRHREFVPLIAAIDTVEGEIGETSPLLLRAETGPLYETLAHELIPPRWARAAPCSRSFGA